MRTADFAKVGDLRVAKRDDYEYRVEILRRGWWPWAEPRWVPVYPLMTPFFSAATAFECLKRYRVAHDEERRWTEVLPPKPDAPPAPPAPQNVRMSR